MMRGLIGGSLLPVLLAACSTTREVFPPLAGHWLPQSAVLGGQDFPVSNFDGAALNLTTESYEFAGDWGTYVLLDWDGSGGMDIHGVHGPNAGRTIPAIYELDWDQLVICYQLGAGDRPEGFESPAGSQVLLVRYSRGL
ncbi:MAG: hypothetical protein EYC70_13425 [Planctomycetota bacterium]|nr:MAG: hypothetical protein EYC70_13425 [Planctomycetota bacterium]